MITILSGVGLLLAALAGFSLFSLKMPKGQLAMSGMANAAVATFLVEAIHKYITGDLLGLSFFRTVGETSGSLGGVAAAIMVPLSMGANPVLSVVAGVAVGSYGILPGFIAGYLVGMVSPILEKKLPEGLNIILGALLIAPFAHLIAWASDPVVSVVLTRIGGTITAATEQSPIVMGFLLGGIMKMICTSPLSSMALTAMLGLSGLPMGIAAIACVGGSFTNGIIFARLKLGDKSKVVAVMLPDPGTVSALCLQPAFTGDTGSRLRHRRRFPGRLCRQPGVQTPQKTGISSLLFLRYHSALPFRQGPHTGPVWDAGRFPFPFPLHPGSSRPSLLHFCRPAS